MGGLGGLSGLRGIQPLTGQYVFADNFNNNSINTKLWTETDADGHLAEQNGQIEIDGGRTPVPAWGDPELVSIGLARVAGRKLSVKVTPGAADTYFCVWLGTNTAFSDPLAANTEHAIFFEQDGTYAVCESGARVRDDAGDTYAGGSDYVIEFELKAEGCTYSINGTEKHDSSSGNTATLYLVLASYNGAVDFDDVEFA